MDGFALDECLSWNLSCFTSLGLSWTTSMTGTLRGIAGGLALLNIYYRVLNASLCPFTSLDSGFSGAVLCSAQIKSCAA